MNNKSIQILRTTLDNTDDKVKNEVLLDGQPFYNKTSNKLYIGDGSTNISELKYVGQEVDQYLGTRITNETNERKAADSDIRTLLSEETTARQEADISLGTRITNETKLTSETAADDTIKFKIGEQGYNKTINNVANAQNVSDSIANTSLSDIFEYNTESESAKFTPVVQKTLRVVLSLPDKNVELPLLLGDASTPGAFSYVFGAQDNNNLDALTYRIDSQTLNVHNIKAKNKIEADHFNATSDKRLKENIKQFEYKKSILDLPIYTFNFKADKEKNLHVGCLAQDLQEICPEIVHENENGYLSIEETKLVYLLLEEVKKLKAEIDKLRRV